MKAKRILALSLSAILALSLLSGCAPAGGNPGNSSSPAPSTTPSEAPPAPKAAELTVVTTYGGDDGNRINYENAIKSYEGATGNKILDASGTSNEEWKAKILTDFQTGAEPDVLFFFTNADAEPIITANKVVDLATIRKEYPDYGSNMKENMLAVAKDGKNYALPSSGFWENMFVNTKVLKEAGVAIPGPDYTWEQFLKDCEAIKAKGKTPIAVSLFEVPHYWFEFMVMNHGSSANHLEVPKVGADGKLVKDATAQKWIDGLNDIKTLYEKGYLPKNTLTATDPETVQLMADGDAAFLIDGSWKVGYFLKDHADKLDDYAIAYAPGQGQRKASDIIGGISMGYFITQKAWNDPVKREAAVKFVEHMTSDKVLSTFVTTEVTALKNGAAPAGLNPLQQAAANTNGKVTSIVGAVQDAISKEAKGSLFGDVQKIVTGQITAEAALENAMKLNK